MKNKKQVREISIGDLLPIGMTLIVLGIGLSFGANIVSDIGNDFTSGSTEEGIINNTLDGIDTLASKMGIIALAVVAGVIIFILYRYLMPGRM